MERTQDLRESASSSKQESPGPGRGECQERGLEKGELATIEVVDIILNYFSDKHGISLTLKSENLVTGEVRVLGGGHVDPDS